MNGEYLKAMDFDRFYEMAEPYIRQVIKKDLDLKKIAAMVKTRIEIFPDIADHIDFFQELPEYDVAMYTHKKMKTNGENSLQVLKDVLPILEAQEDFTNDALYASLAQYVSCRTGLRKNHGNHPPGQMSGGGLRGGSGKYPGYYIYKSCCLRDEAAFPEADGGTESPRQLWYLSRGIFQYSQTCIPL